MTTTRSASSQTTSPPAGSAGPVYIHAAAALGPHGDSVRDQRRRLQGDPPPLDLKPLVKSVIGIPLRQASHLVELAAIGAQLCLQRLSHPVPTDCAVYLGTGLAEVRKNDAVFRQVMPPGPGLASPFDFINAASNMPAFYVAKLANLSARNLTVTQEEHSFEWALQLAMSDLGNGEYRHALVGGVDENSQPRASHLRRLTLRDDQPMGEGSGWLVLSTQAALALGELVDVQYLTHAVDGVEHLRHWQQDQESLTLLPGLRLDNDEIRSLMKAVPGLKLEPYLDYCGGYHSAAAFGIASVFDAPRKPGLFLHLNRDARGHAMLCVLRVF